MNQTTMIRLMLTAGLSLAIASPACAQSTLGGANQQQNKIGGVAKPAPSVGGATVQTPPPPPPKPVVNTVKPTTPGVTTPGLTSNATTGQPPAPKPPVTPPNKGGPVVTSNLKCANGACTSKGPKP